MVVDLKPHQTNVVDKMHNGCILLGGVGSGKGITSLAYFYTKVCGGVINDRGSMRKPRDLYVITTAKKRDTHDWEDDAAKFAIGPNPENSVGNINFIVDSWNNIANYRDVRDAFFIFDEQRAVGAGSWSKSFIHIAGRNQWILLSATPADNWIDLIPLFVANGFYPNRTAFKREHVVYSNYGPYPKVERFLGEQKLARLRRQIVVHMPYERHTKRYLKDVEVQYDQELYRKVVNDRWHVYENRPLKDVGELFRVMRKVVNSNSSRVETVQKLLEEHPKLIVFYNFDYELEQLRKLQTWNPSTAHSAISSELGRSSGPVAEATTSTETRQDAGSKRSEPGPSLGKETSTRKSGPKLKVSGNGSSSSPGSSGSTTVSTSSTSPETFSVAEWNGHKHQEVPKTDRWAYLVQYVAGSEGWNCVETDAICFYSLTYSYKNFEQAQGRIDRMNTPFTSLYYYVLRSRASIDVAIARALAGKKNFNEGAFLSKTDIKRAS